MNYKKIDVSHPVRGKDGRVNAYNQSKSELIWA